MGFLAHFLGSNQNIMMMKEAEIRIIGGKYGRKHGWLDVSWGYEGYLASKKSVYIIYCDKNGPGLAGNLWII